MFESGPSLKNQLIKNYFNLSSSKTLLDFSNSYNLIGIYSNVSVVNVTIQLFKIRKSISLILNYCKKNKFCNPLIVNTIDNNVTFKLYKRLYRKNNTSYFLGNWLNGLLINFKRFIMYKNKRKKQCSFYKNNYPNYCLYVSQQNYNVKDTYSKNFYKETNKVSMLTMYMVNSTTNHLKVPGAIISNTKTVINNVFINKMFLSIVSKSKFIVKKRFILFVIKKWNLFKLDRYSRKIVFEYYFRNKKKKVFWNHILK